MLKALELNGFKSFADKTRFEFPEGITVVVGPNGSGKSNIVDGIKWVLGEQSAKSLRGKDMSDVIFKGSGNTGRKPLNTAEATLVFDNSSGTLPVDAPEVHITRRVYRSGEGEYLINRKPCRLKDIRDLCRGTGVGVDAYSLIEQGKVDKLLQANPKDRRAIFEEAAGISRFKAKKIEAQRRLERVDQNMLRLSDIVDEVESRLRSVRAQAGKAQRYREYSDRLQQLRTQVGLTDWRKITQKLQAIEDEIVQLRQQAGDFDTQSTECDSQLESVDQMIAQVGDAIRESESQFVDIRGQIQAREAAVANERDRCQDFEENALRHRRQWQALTGRAGDMLGRLKETSEKLKTAESQFSDVKQTAEQHENAAAELAEEMDRLRSENETCRAEYVDQMRHAAMFSNEVSGLESELTALQASADRTLEQIQQLDAERATHVTQLDEARLAEQQLDQESMEKAEALEAAEIELAENRRVLARRQEELASMQGQHSGAAQRAKVIEELERQNAGLSTGVQDLLAEAAAQEEASRDIRGMVADLIETDVEYAAMVDVALGDVAQHVVVHGDRLHRRLQSAELKPSGRVGLLRLDSIHSTAPITSGLPFGFRDLQNRPGVIGRADRLVRTSDEYQSLVRHLLGDTWLVSTLNDALTYSRTSGKGQRFVTVAGELVQRDGTLVAGPIQSTVGLVSRRSELRALQKEIIDVQRRITGFVLEMSRLRENIERQDHQHKLMVDAYKTLSVALADQRVRTRTLQDREDQLKKHRKTLIVERDASQAKFNAAVTKLEAARIQLAACEKQVAEMETRIRTTDREIESREKHLQKHSAEATTAKVALAKSEQQLEGLRTQKTQFEADQRERDRAVTEEWTQLQSALQRRQQAERSILKSTSQLADLYLRKESLARQTQTEILRRQSLVTERTEIARSAEKLRRQLRKTEDQLHKQELAAGEYQHERNSLAERLRDDYGIELADLEQEETAEEESRRTEVESEIADLRNKINRIGAVNLDALNELDDLDERFASLSGQYQDLVQAKESLERIISKINTDSRRLFMETLEAIRANFQVLYRKAFGGGRADIVLEEGKDVLECGVEIVATPPGKPSFNNSLLSGGEKALTAVSLLLAIFQFRPSPFCILDEVDAPFDEANVGRFVDVLKDFLDWTKFVIVTHSKKTMTAATTLYGVTMQESGVSKRVSVRFEDVSEDGEISEDALKRADDSGDGDEQAA